MMEEFNLSDEIEFVHEYEIKKFKKDIHPASIEKVIITSKIKEFIKLLKEKILTDKGLKDWEIRIITIIDKLAGKELV